MNEEQFHKHLARMIILEFYKQHGKNLGDIFEHQFNGARRGGVPL